MIRSDLRPPRLRAGGLRNMSDTSKVRTEWRGQVESGELRSLFEDARGQPLGEQDMVGRVQAHSLGWVTARNGDGCVVGFVNVAWDGALHAFLIDTSVASRTQRQ